MDDQLKIFLATIYGEAAKSSEAAWKAIASVILNRVGEREWWKFKTPLAIIAHTGFDAYTHRNAPYLAALRLLEDPDAIPATSPLGRLMAAVLPIYGGRAARTTDAILYYSPFAQAQLHAQSKQPGYRGPKYAKVPDWHFERLDKVDVPGTEADDFAWFRYRRGA